MDASFKNESKPVWGMGVLNELIWNINAYHFEMQVYFCRCEANNDSFFFFLFPRPDPHPCRTQYIIFHPFQPNCVGHPQVNKPVQDSATQLSMMNAKPDLTVIQNKKQISVIE